MVPTRFTRQLLVSYSRGISVHLNALGTETVSFYLFWSQKKKKKTPILEKEGGGGEGVRLVLTAFITVTGKDVMFALEVGLRPPVAKIHCRNDLWPKSCQGKKDCFREQHNDEREKTCVKEKSKGVCLAAIYTCYSQVTNSRWGDGDSLISPFWISKQLIYMYVCTIWGKGATLWWLN